MWDSVVCWEKDNNEDNLTVSDLGESGRRDRERITNILPNVTSRDDSQALSSGWTMLLLFHHPQKARALHVLSWGWRCDGTKDRNRSLRQQKPMMTGKSYPQILSNQFANFFLLKSLRGEIVPRLATKLEWLQAGLASVRLLGACPVTPAPPSSPLPPSVLIRKNDRSSMRS